METAIPSINPANQPTRLAEGSTLYYALHTVPEPCREKLLATLHLCRTLADTLDDVSEPGVASSKIHWWHEEIDRLSAGQARHPATQAVAKLLGKQLPDSANWLAILSVNSDEKFTNAKNETELLARLQRDYNARIKMCSQILQGHPEAPTEHWAMGFGQFDRLRNFHRLYRHGYPVFPDDSYAKLGLEPADIPNNAKRERVASLFAERISIAVTALDTALSEPDPALGDGSQPLYVLATLYIAQLRLWQKQALLPSEAYSTLTPLRKAWLAWRCRSRH